MAILYIHGSFKPAALLLRYIHVKSIGATYRQLADLQVDGSTGHTGSHKHTRKAFALKTSYGQIRMLKMDEEKASNIRYQPEADGLMVCLDNAHRILLAGSRSAAIMFGYNAVR